MSVRLKAWRTATNAVLLVLAIYLLLILAGHRVPPRGLDLNRMVIVTLVVAYLRFGIRPEGHPSWIRPGPTILIGVLLAYLSNGQTHWSGDTIPARYLPLSLIREGDFDFNEFPFRTACLTTFKS